MEVSSRDTIKHKIRIKEDGKPSIKPIGDDLCHALQKHITTNNNHLSKLARLKIIYGLLDKIMDVNQETSVCRKGCSHCCRIAVEILPLEAQYIAANTKHKVRTELNKKPGKIGYCPFMDKKTAECTVYDFRPFACRAFAAYDSPEYCKTDQKHWTTGGPANGYGSEASLYLAMEMIEIETGKPLSPTVRLIIECRVNDIREFFR